MTEHTKVDFGAERVDGDIASTPGPVLEEGGAAQQRMASNKIECNACPVLCQISKGAPAHAIAMRMRTGG